MLPKTIPLPGGRGWRMSPVRAPEWSPCPFTSTLRPMVRSGKRRAGTRDGAGPAVDGAALETSASSTTWIVSDIPHPHHALRAALRPVLGAGGELRRTPADRKLDDEQAAASEVVSHPDEPVVVRDDRGHDREPVAGAVGLGREV